MTRAVREPTVSAAAPTSQACQRVVRSFLFTLPIVIGTAGCALTYLDDQGNRHTTGFVLDLTVRAPEDRDTIAGDVVELTTFGLAIGQTTQGGYVSAGYSREATAALRDSTLVVGNPVRALKEHSAVRSE
jgi:hypothetical protein